MRGGNPPTVYWGGDESAKKFAELIVRECASIVDLHGRWVLYDKLAVKIKKHFGVEL
jgi:hypothetical protein